MSNKKDQRKEGLDPSSKREIEKYSSALISRGLELSKIIELEQKEEVVGISISDLEALLLTEKGREAIKAGNYSKAIEFYKRAIRQNLDLTTAHNDLGLVYVYLGRYEEAVEAFKQVVRINPYDSKAHYCLGFAYNHLGRHSEAIKALKEAIRIDPDDVHAHYALGLVYLEIKDRSMAIEQYKILRNLDGEKANALFKLIYE
jgi:tetratricopeptide (TPR) repeat protein